MQSVLQVYDQAGKPGVTVSKCQPAGHIGYKAGSQARGRTVRQALRDQAADSLSVSLPAAVNVALGGRCQPRHLAVDAGLDHFWWPPAPS